MGPVGVEGQRSPRYSGCACLDGEHAGEVAPMLVVRCESDVGAAIDACSRGGAAVRAIAEEPASSGPSKQSAVIEDVVALYQY